MRYIATVDDQTFTIAVPENGHERTVTLGGRALDVDWQPVGDAPLAAFSYNPLSTFAADRND